VKNLAFRMALTTKYLQSKVIVVDEIKMNTIKTKEAVNSLKGFNLHSDHTCLIVDEKVDNNFEKSSWNLKFVNYLNSKGLNVYDILRNDLLIITKDGLKSIENRVINN
jgi:large subunit ribosomal protein L4